MSERCIYALIDPRDGKVKYVGSSRLPKLRLYQHGRINPTEHRTPLVAWKKSMIDDGCKPIVRILEWSGSYRREGWWIRYFAKKGQPLTNSVIPAHIPPKVKYQLSK